MPSRTTTTITVGIALCLVACNRHAQRAKTSQAAEFAPDRLVRIDQLMQSYVDSNKIGGAVGLCCAMAA
ncbi:MAG: hypothetical protein M3Y64_11770 [Gemmatimonadota bacterium]|nr:hypothetical protein [Gemmatimonadota bacterium]